MSVEITQTEGQHENQAVTPGMEMTPESMQEPFSRFAKDFPEMYEVVKTAIVARNRRLYKIEVLKDHTAVAGYKVHFSLQERVSIESIDSASQDRFKKVWVDLTLPWVETADVDSALSQALLQISQLTP